MLLTHMRSPLGCCGQVACTHACTCGSARARPVGRQALPATCTPGWVPGLCVPCLHRQGALPTTACFPRWPPVPLLPLPPPLARTYPTHHPRAAGTPTTMTQPGGRAFPNGHRACGLCLPLKAPFARRARSAAASPPLPAPPPHTFSPRPQSPARPRGALDSCPHACTHLAA